MKTLDEIRSMLKENRSVLVEEYGIAVVGIFGSYVRDEQTPGSDLDLLAEILRPISLLELVGAELYLSDVLGVKVDLIPRRNLREELREAVFKEAVSV